MYNSTDPFNDLIPVSGAPSGSAHVPVTPAPAPTPAPTTGGTAPMTGARPKLTDFPKAGGQGFDTQAYLAAVKAWRTGSTAAPGTTTGTPPATGTGTGTGTTTGGSQPLSGSQFTDLIRNTPGYQFQLSEGLKAVNSNAYARGLGNSGATMKALTEYGKNLADSYYQQYLTNVMGVAEQGRGAASAIAGAGDNMGAGVAGAMGNQAQAYQNGANGVANAANNQANITGSLAGSVAGALGNIGGSMFGSSYGTSAPATSTVVGGGFSGPAISDRRLKTNIVKVGEASDGLGIYDYEYTFAPNETVRGVMADEVAKLRPWAFVPNLVGDFSGVDYSNLGDIN